MRVALIHDWLNGMRGGEKVLEVFCELFPRADIFTLVLERDKLSETIAGMKIKTSFIQNLPGGRSHYRHYLPLFPAAIESFDLSGYDLVISTSHAVAKGARTPASALHICYCFTPMRYIWFFYNDYFGSGKLRKLLLRPVLAYLRRWDVSSSRRVDQFWAISKNVARRIESVYSRKSRVIYPPVDGDFFRPGGVPGDYFLVVSALVPYKKVDLAVSVFNRLKLPLKIIGTGPRDKQLRKAAAANIEFLGWQDNRSLREYYRSCRALIFPGEEDFGIVPLEAMVCGRPVIGRGAGGLLETVIPWMETGESSPTGVFFYQQTEDSLLGAIDLFLKKEDEFNRQAIRDHALKFNRDNFQRNISTALAEAREEWRHQRG